MFSDEHDLKVIVILKKLIKIESGKVFLINFCKRGKGDDK